MGAARELAWVVTRVGRSEGECRDEFAKLVEEVEHEWQALFPRRLGYSVGAERWEDSDVRLTVSRGDFVGKLELCCARDRGVDPGALMIRLVASADSRELLAARSAGRRAIDWASALATCAGALLSIGFCWLTVGVESAPLLVGLMLTVIIGVLLLGGHSLGVRLGEDLASHYELRAERRRDDDVGLQADLERWKSLARRLRGHRRALARGLVGTPFRRG